MGFGSYDESEQREQDYGDDDDEDAVLNVHDDEFEGEMSVDTTASTEELVQGLDEMKSEDE